MAFCGTCARYLCIQYYLTGSDMYLQSHLGLCKAVVYSRLSGEDKGAATGAGEWAKSLRAATGLDGNGQWQRQKRQGGRSGVRKDQRCVFRRAHTVTRECLCELPVSDDTSKGTQLKQFFSFHKTKLHQAAGGRGSPLHWTKGLSVMAGGQEGGQNSNRGTMALWESKLTHIHSLKECMANQTPARKNKNK